MKSASVMHVTFDMGFGGAEQVIRQLVLASSELGVDSAVACIDSVPGPMGMALKDAGHEVIGFERRPGFDRALVAALRGEIRSRGIDIVHCHQYTPWVYGWLAARGTPARVVFTEHGRFHPDRRRFKRWAPNLIMSRRTARITAISEATAAALARYEFVPRRLVEVIYNGIQPLEARPEAVAEVRASLGLNPSDVVIGTVARLDPIKNHTMLLRAFARIAARRHDVRLLIVGDGPLREPLLAETQALGIDDRVLLPGFRHDPAPYLGSMDLYVLPSLSEGTSMTLLEAMSLGLPCVVTDVGGNPEIVDDGVTGQIVPSDDAEALAGAMGSMLGQPQLRAEMGARARQRFAARFDARVMTAAYRRLYESLLAIDPA